MTSDNEKEIKRAYKSFTRLRKRLERVMSNDSQHIVVFRTFYTDTEKERIRKKIKEDVDEEEFFKNQKESEFENLLDKVCEKEHLFPYSLIVFKPTIVGQKTIWKFDGEFKRFYSLEEFLVEAYKKGDFELHTTASNDVVLDLNGELFVLFYLKPEGDMLYRTMIHNPIYGSKTNQIQYIGRNIILNLHIVENVNKIIELPSPLVTGYADKLLKPLEK